MSLFKNIALSCLTLALLSGCQEPEEIYVDRSVEDLYSIARTRLNERNYSKAATAFAEVERQHPYSNWALKAQIMSAYCFYEAKKYDEAIDGFKIFIQLHPGHADVAYAYYMIGLCFYEQIPIVERDQQPSEKSMEAFDEVLNRLPTSVYAKDARFKIDLIKDHIAGKEMDVGRYYLSKGSYISAINRFKNVVENYQSTAQTEEALYRLVESYLSVGLKDQAIASAAVLGYNHPYGQWYKNAYALLQSTSITIPEPSAVEKQAKDRNHSQEKANKQAIENTEDLAKTPPNNDLPTAP